MGLLINETAPDFEADTTEGRINFHDWIGDSWAVLFSHPKDFTPVCTTELGYMAKIKPEFDKRGVKIIGLSVDPIDKHSGWAADIKETQGHAPNYPIIGDSDFNVSKLYGMLPAAVSGDPAKRTPMGGAKYKQPCSGDPGKFAPAATKKVEVLSCKHPDFDAPMIFGRAPGIEYLHVNDDCNMQGGGYRAIAADGSVAPVR